MNAPLDNAVLAAMANASLDDKYTLEKGRVYISGSQALVRLPMLQKQRDRLAGLNTAGFISGYRGSPLGALDQALWKARAHLKENDIVFQPGVNEDLAATSVWGTQQVNLYQDATRDGVFGMWYGKGPGVDRSTDVFKHANNAGTSRHGGVLVLAGDDHGAKSSTVAHQSEQVLAAAGMPVLYPATVQEYLDFGLHGWAMSRYTGLWVAMKCVTEVIESTASVDIDPDRAQIVIPDDFALPPDGLNLRWPDPPLEQEARLMNVKLYAAMAYVRANRLNQVVIDAPQASLGIMAAGKAYLDTRQALADLGLDDDACRQAGIRLMKVGCVWPLHAQDVHDFADGLRDILVVEEKRPVLEQAMKEALYHWPDDRRPAIHGKFLGGAQATGEWSVPRAPWLLPAQAELSPVGIARAMAQFLLQADLPEALRTRIQARIAIMDAKEQERPLPLAAERKPWFCSGCPHNTSTRVPDGSRALAGIGCHYMTIWMDRKTATFSHMGGEGAAWIGQHHFTSEKHVFANLGDGTYFHSGLLAIRAAIAANVNITYKILYNDAVAMTGGQPVDGQLRVPDVVAQVQAEGARKVVIVTDEPEKYRGVSLVGSPTIHHRDELDAVQRELRDHPGVTVLVYDQTCATEKRRRRKRGAYPDPARRAFINDTVCEGCGDCSVKSNCLSVEPLETPLGVKRRINQSSCNKDFSCVNGFCPSFITAEGAQPRKPAAARSAPPSADQLPAPELPALDKAFGIMAAGVGGTGVVTIGGLLGMAAHLEGKGVTVLDMAGLAQKGGAVTSHVQIAPTPQDIHATRIPMGDARVVIGCDALVAASPDVLTRVRHDHTHAVVNTASVPTADIIGNPRWRFPADSTAQRLRQAVGDSCMFIDANALALALMGDTIYANPLLLGYAWQKGWIPLSFESLWRAIVLNGVAVEKNQAAFTWGRAVAHLGADAVMEGVVGAAGAGASRLGGVTHADAADAAGTASAKGDDASASHGDTGVGIAANAPGATSVTPMITAVSRLGASRHAVPDAQQPHDAQPQSESIDALMRRQAQWLTAYQDAAYAQRYLSVVQRVLDRELALAGGHGTDSDTLPLTRTVAVQLARLMAYKDEYEVARLYTNPAFLDKLRQTFEGEPGKDYRIMLHLSPPLLARKDAQGNPRKSAYGPWMLRVFGVLARMKRLRGTALDIFGRTEERRMERQLIQDYTVMLGELLNGLEPRNLALVVELAQSADLIRGYGHVKQAGVDRFRQRQAELLQRFRNRELLDQAA